MEPEADTLTTGDVARLAGVSPRAVQLWERDGKLHAERTAGNVRLFKRSDVVDFLAKRGAK